jgi:hypothetical protein
MLTHCVGCGTQILVLAWADNRKDLEVVWKVLSQVCLAYRADGGRVVVVLCSRDKLVRTLHPFARNACTHAAASPTAMYCLHADDVIFKCEGVTQPDDCHQ